PSAYPDVTFEGATSGLKGAVTFKGTIDTVKQNGNIHAKGSVDLISLVPDDLSKSLPPLNFDKAPYYDLKLEFTDRFSLKSAYLNAEAYGVSVDGITFDYIDARASFKDRVYSLDQVYARRDWQWVDLKFNLDARTWDYKVTLIGSAVPYDYNSVLPGWWASIFREFDFSEVQENHGDFIIYGNAKKSACDLYYGHAFAEKVRFMDVMVDSATTIVRGRGRYSEVTDINAQSNGGWAKGTIAFASFKDEVKAPVSIRMNFDAQLALEDSKKLFGANIATILSDFETSTLPKAHLEGAIFNKAYPQYAGLNYFDLTATSNSPIKFKGVPLDHLSFALYGRERITHIRDLTFGYADGAGTGTIDILTPTGAEPALRYRVSLQDADQGQAIRNLPQLDTIEGDLASKDEAKTDKDGLKEGRLDASLHASGPADNPLLHNGYGAFTIRSKQLGAIQILGPLSRLLQNTRFSFTSFNLQKMFGALELKDGVINFNQLEINGPRTRIIAPGTMALKDQALSMRVSVNLFANVGSPDSPFKKVGDIITSPIPNLLIFDLTGTIKNQKWRSLYDPRKLIPSF
ncbi:MAG: AsmA-like C-terminal region-containing protein, partial [Lentimonas sp.]